MVSRAPHQHLPYFLEAENSRALANQWNQPQRKETSGLTPSRLKSHAGNVKTDKD